MPDSLVSTAAIELAGKVAVVTGSSSGIGQAIAIGTGKCRGRRAHSRRSQPRRRRCDLSRQIRQLGRKSELIVADFTDEEAIASFAESAWNWRGGVDIWVNNAGGDILTGPFARERFDEKLRLLWQIDVRGDRATLAGNRRKMKQRGHGAIVNIGWDQAATGMAGDSGELFATTKGAVTSFTLSLAKSLAPEVRVNCVAPGWIKTAWGGQASRIWDDRIADETLLAPLGHAAGRGASRPVFGLAGGGVHHRPGVRGQRRTERMKATPMIRRSHQLESESPPPSTDDWPGTIVELDAALDPVEAFQRLCHLPHCIFFDSAQRGGSVGRYSFIAADPFEVLTASPDDRDGLGPNRWIAPTVINRLPLPDLPPFQGGMAGMFGYELAHSLERLPAARFDEFQVPGLFLGLYDVVVAFDHERGKAWIISQGFPEIEPAQRRRRAEERANEFRRWLDATPIRSPASSQPKRSIDSRRAIGAAICDGQTA